MKINVTEKKSYKYLSEMFYTEYKPKEVYLNNDNKINNFTNEIELEVGENIIEIIYDDMIVTNCSKMFYNCSFIESIDLSNFNSSNVIEMIGMFYLCSSLKSLDLSNFDTSNVYDMTGMF